MYYYVHMFCRLRKILPSQILLKIYKYYMQSKIDYGLSIWGCTREANLDRIQRIQNLLASIMCNNFDFINFRGIEMVRTLRLQTIRERRDYFPCILMFKVSMALLLIIHVLMSLCMLTKMDIIQEVPKTWNYIYHVAQGKFIKGVFSTKAVPFGISYCHAWRNLYR